MSLLKSHHPGVGRSQTQSEVKLEKTPEGIDTHPEVVLLMAVAVAVEVGSGEEGDGKGAIARQTADLAVKQRNQGGMLGQKFA